MLFTYIIEHARKESFLIFLPFLEDRLLVLTNSVAFFEVSDGHRSDLLRFKMGQMFVPILLMPRVVFRLSSDGLLINKPF